MRNPWGSETYTGPWNDQDTQWTEEFQAQVNHIRADDGTFYIPLDNFRNAFTWYNIAMYSDDWKIEQEDFKLSG